MKDRQRFLVAGLVCVGLCWALAGPIAAHAQEEAKEPAKTAECTDEELSTSVPALKDLHEAVYPLWHTAYPNKDYAMIKELLPELDDLVGKLDAARLPGILRDKQADWDKGKVVLKTSLNELHTAADSDNQVAMLEQAEAFHSAYEGLVRVIRPVAPELDAFHKELYKLYHYYTPDYDLAGIREAVAAMQEKMPPLKEAKLSKRLADKQEKFDAAVVDLDGAVAELARAVKGDDKDAILKGVEKVHSAYVKTEDVFN